jgi:peroxiredoxin
MISHPDSAAQRKKAALALLIVLVGASAALGVWLFVCSKYGYGTGGGPPGPAEKITAHPVTTEMAQRSEAQSNRQAPRFDLEGTDGNMHALTGATKDGPLVLLFIRYNCPCSETAQPFFNRLWQGYHEKVGFLGVINGDMTKAKAWQSANQIPFTILADPKESVIQSYEAEHSAYSALVTSNGALEKLWPGFSKTMLNTLSKRLAELTGQEPAALQVADAPEEMYSGCPFKWASAAKSAAGDKRTGERDIGQVSPSGGKGEK